MPERLALLNIALLSFAALVMAVKMFFLHALLCLFTHAVGSLAHFHAVISPWFTPACVLSLPNRKTYPQKNVHRKFVMQICRKCDGENKEGNQIQKGKEPKGHRRINKKEEKEYRLLRELQTVIIYN